MNDQGLFDHFADQVCRAWERRKRVREAAAYTVFHKIASGLSGDALKNYYNHEVENIELIMKAHDALDEF